MLFFFFQAGLVARTRGYGENAVGTDAENTLLALERRINI